MASSVEARGAWSNVEDVVLCECWVKVSYCPISGNEIKFSQMWKKIHEEFVERFGSGRTETALASRWKILNKELGKWRDALAKARENHRSGQNLTNEIVQAQMWFGATGQGKNTFQHQECWEIVKNCSRFKIICTTPPVMLNETPLHDLSTTDSPLDSPMDQDSPRPRAPRPIGRKAAKAKKGSTSNNECAQFLEQMAKNSALRLERELKREEVDKAREEAFSIQRAKAQEQDMEDREMKIMAMDTTHMSPDTKSYWKMKRRDVMRRKLFHDDGPSNTDGLNDGNL
ncbi:glutathione S-transferase T3-like [Prunus avium]|uniref:Glutathione S-transferase T3-like n=1 Tax=Prunus avium TaxID=42229 RepID=A0A6P5TSJ1_PRUAV|nr:glutathione S-transferase T3-like [Prunus avium]